MNEFELGMGTPPCDFPLVSDIYIGPPVVIQGSAMFLDLFVR